MLYKIVRTSALVIAACAGAITMLTNAVQIIVLSWPVLKHSIGMLMGLALIGVSYLLYERTR